MKKIGSLTKEIKDTKYNQIKMLKPKNISKAKKHSGWNKIKQNKQKERINEHKGRTILEI